MIAKHLCALESKKTIHSYKVFKIHHILEMHIFMILVTDEQITHC
jgi:hypothetical protein